MKVVQVRKLTKYFGSYIAVDHISFDVKKGEVVGFLGPNGAGKTTTIHMMLGLITPTSGEIYMFEKDFSQHREEILSLVNFSSSYTHLPWRLTVWENLYVTALLYSVVKPKEKIEGVVKTFGLEKVKHDPIDKLSSGWVTRVNLARTFINDPKLILLDEPTASLDPEGAEEIRREILKKKDDLGATIFWTSHNMAEVEEVCDRVIFLQRGKIIAEDTPTGLAKRVKKCRVSLMVEERVNELTILIKSHGWQYQKIGRFSVVELEEKDIPNLLELLSQKSIQYDEISIEKPTLNDFFLAMGDKK